jgi:hypothetical protein
VNWGIIGIASSPVDFSYAIPLQDERDYGNDNKDYYEPFCDFHSETGYTFHAHNKKHQGKDKEDNRKVN